MAPRTAADKSYDADIGSLPTNLRLPSKKSRDDKHKAIVALGAKLAIARNHGVDVEQTVRYLELLNAVSTAVASGTSTLGKFKKDNGISINQEAKSYLHLVGMYAAMGGAQSFVAAKQTPTPDDFQSSFSRHIIQNAQPIASASRLYTSRQALENDTFTVPKKFKGTREEYRKVQQQQINSKHTKAIAPTIAVSDAKVAELIAKKAEAMGRANMQDGMGLDVPVHSMLVTACRNEVVAHYGKVMSAQALSKKCDTAITKYGFIAPETMRSIVSAAITGTKAKFEQDKTEISKENKAPFQEEARKIARDKVGECIAFMSDDFLRKYVFPAVDKFIGSTSGLALKKRDKPAEVIEGPGEAQEDRSRVAVDVDVPPAPAVDGEGEVAPPPAKKANPGLQGLGSLVKAKVQAQGGASI